MPTAANDRDAVIATVLDYFEGWFDADPSRMERALHPELAKRGVGPDETGRQTLHPSTAEEMIAGTRDGLGAAQKPQDPAIAVEVDDIDGEIATATVHSAVYVEYVHLVRTPAGWKIVNTLYHRVSTPQL